jgi:hypothetical protein
VLPFAQHDQQKDGPEDLVSQSRIAILGVGSRSPVLGPPSRRGAVLLKDPTQIFSTKKLT